MPLSKKGRYVRCSNCLCGLEMNGVCEICGHRDIPPLPGMVPHLIGKTQEEAAIMLIDPEAQLVMGIITTENSDTVAIDLIISSDPAADSELAIGSAVDLVVSLGPAA